MCLSLLRILWCITWESRNVRIPACCNNSWNSQPTNSPPLPCTQQFGHGQLASKALANLPAMWNAVFVFNPNQFGHVDACQHLQFDLLTLNCNLPRANQINGTFIPRGQQCSPSWWLPMTSAWQLQLLTSDKIHTSASCISSSNWDDKSEFERHHANEFFHNGQVFCGTNARWHSLMQLGHTFQIFKIFDSLDCFCKHGTTNSNVASNCACVSCTWK